MDENYIELVRESLGYALKNNLRSEENVESGEVVKKVLKPKLQKSKLKTSSKDNRDNNNDNKEIELEHSVSSAKLNHVEESCSAKLNYVEDSAKLNRKSKNKVEKPSKAIRRASGLSLKQDTDVLSLWSPVNKKKKVKKASTLTNQNSNVSFKIKNVKSKCMKSLLETTNTVSSSDSDEITFEVVAPSKSSELVTTEPQNVTKPKKKKIKDKKIKPVKKSKRTSQKPVVLKEEPIINISSDDSEPKEDFSNNEAVTFEDFSSKYELNINQPSGLIEEYTSVTNLFNFCEPSSDSTFLQKSEKKTTKAKKRGREKVVKKNTSDLKVIEDVGFEESFEKDQEPFYENIDNNNDWKEDSFDSNNSIKKNNSSLEFNEESEENITKSQKSFKLIKSTTGGERYLILEPNSSLYFHGLVSIKVIHGELEVLGSVMTKSTSEQQLYSPRGTALLYLKNYKNSTGENQVSLIELGIFGMNKNLINENCVIFKYQYFKEPIMNFVVKYTSQQILPDNNQKVIFDPQGSYAKLKTNNKNWDSAIDLLDSDHKKLLVIGGKGVGKSTFLRYAINELLTKHSRIRLMDLDPGQSEFTVPGCVSITTVDKPVFGPNYSHLRNSDSALLANINVATDIKKFITSVKHLNNELCQMDNIPTLINFMGFTQDMGYDILSACIAICQPNYVLNIISRSANKNYQIPVTVENIKKYCTKLCEVDTENMENFETVETESMVDHDEAWKLEPRQARETCILAYFGQMMNQYVTSLTSSNLKMFCIELSLIKITDFDKHEISPLAANANLVALCSTPYDNTELFKCYGHGIVRGVDVESDILVLLTPLDGAELEKVSHLVVSSVALPPSALMTVDEVTGHVPYVNRGEVVGLGQLTKRSYLPKK